MPNNSINESKKINQCLITGKPVEKILDFGQHAYADTFIAENQLNLSEPIFPLQVYINSDSGSIQLGYVSDAQDRYNLYSYSYTSSNSKTARDHWDEYADTVKKKYKTDMVVEIGSNDGYLIGQFKNESNVAIGIDSSIDMCAIAESQGIKTVNTLFDRETAQIIRIGHGPADVIIANNVFNHANNPVAFAQAVADLLNPDSGVFVFEVPYWKCMVESGRFTDMVYHEHPTYFTIKMAWSILALAGMEIVDFDVVDYHGGSLRVTAKRTKNGMTEKIKNAIVEETVIGLFNKDFYQDLQRQFELSRAQWLSNFNQIYMTDPDAVFIGVGAAAKANTWLTWHGLNSTHLHCITDSSIHKQGKYTPLTRIPIRDDNEFAQHKSPYALILSWNIGAGLKKAILNINPNTRFLSQ